MTFFFFFFFFTSPFFRRFSEIAFFDHFPPSNSARLSSTLGRVTNSSRQSSFRAKIRAQTRRAVGRPFFGDARNRVASRKLADASYAVKFDHRRRLRTLQVWRSLCHLDSDVSCFYLGTIFFDTFST